MDLRTKIVAIEGDDGAGKTTMSKHFAQELVNKGFKVLTLDQEELPDYATKIREIVTGPIMSTIDVEIKALMFVTYLLDIYENVVNKNFGKYDYIILDRSLISTLVYQNGSIMLSILEEHLLDTLNYDAIIFLDVRAGIGIERIKKNRNGELDDTERKSTLHVLGQRRKLYQKYFNEIDSVAFDTYLVDANKSEVDVKKKMSQIAEIITND